MKYVKINCISDSIELEFYIEVTGDDMENRKGELANGGILGFANTEISFHGTTLADTPLLSNQKISSNPSIKVVEITKEDFELIWIQVVNAASLVN